MPKEKKTENNEQESATKWYFGVGRRKTAIARARVYPATAEVTIDGKKLEKGDTFVNGKPIEKYFPDPFAKSQYSELFRTTNTAGRFITTVVVEGSGLTGQLGATTLAIARALVQVDPKFRAILRKKDYMTRDPRMKEPKKPGLPGARKKKSSPKR
ncbi:mitochondrial small ribosomal subunit protein uS9m [Patescibacteria group bacterium]|nr:mitochondrial small ribosomal subunit protein uS9m [Patescibacteria group bacterium]